MYVGEALASILDAIDHERELTVAEKIASETKTKSSASGIKNASITVRPLNSILPAQRSTHFILIENPMGEYFPEPPSSMTRLFKLPTIEELNRHERQLQKIKTPEMPFGLLWFQPCIDRPDHCYYNGGN